MKRFSMQRQTVYDILCGTKSHPSADWVYTRARERIPNISLGTVYRNLAELKREGNIIGFTDEIGTEHFDATTTPHVHFRCTECGEITDIPFASTETVDAQVAEHGTVQSCVCLYFGKCKKCNTK